MLSWIKSWLTLPVLQTVLRTVLKVAGGALVTSGLLSAANLEAGIGAVALLVGLIWGMANAKNKALAPPAPPAE